MRKSEVLHAASEGAGINFLIALAAGVVGKDIGPYVPSIIQAAASLSLGMYWADEKPNAAIAVTAGGLMTASALATAVAARQLATASLERQGIRAEVDYEAPGIPFRPGYHLPQGLPSK